jgi:hypothetical protein
MGLEYNIMKMYSNGTEKEREEEINERRETEGNGTRKTTTKGIPSSEAARDSMGLEAARVRRRTWTGECHRPGRNHVSK